MLGFACAGIASLGVWGCDFFDARCAPRDFIKDVLFQTLRELSIAVHSTKEVDHGKRSRI